jgi:hypothetical protein
MEDRRYSGRLRGIAHAMKAFNFPPMGLRAEMMGSVLEAAGGTVNL